MTLQLFFMLFALQASLKTTAISPNGKFAYVTNFTSNVVDVIKLKS